MSKSSKFIRPQAQELLNRLRESRRFIQVISGARQVGKSTLATDVAGFLNRQEHYASADEPTLRGSEWIEQQWEIARGLAVGPSTQGALLILDEIQKMTGWSETVKRLWDEDSRTGRNVKVVLLGSAPLLVASGLSESLAGRFELLHLPHWGCPEMREAFDISLEEYIFYGAYPGAAPLIHDPARWSRYIRDSLIEPVISRDVLLLTRVDKPVLLRRLLELGCAYSSQILSYTKILGKLHDAGNTTTLAHYLGLLSGAGLITGLQKFSLGAARRRASSPKLQVYNTALITSGSGISLAEARQDHAFWGRIVESTIGAHIVNAIASGVCEGYYWRDRNREVDFVLRRGRKLVAIEVKSGRAPSALPGMTEFSKRFQPTRKLLVGADGIDVGTFLSRPIEEWIEG